MRALLPTTCPLDCCCAWQAEGLREAVVHYILATKQHHTEEGGEADLALFLDTDMSILGQPRQGAYYRWHV